MPDRRPFRPPESLRLLDRVARPDAQDDTLLAAWAGCCAVRDDRSAYAGYVAIEGELDAFTAAALRRPLLDYAAYAGELVVDLGELRFVDSAGVDLLEEVTERQLRHGGFVQLHEPSPTVRRVIELVADTRRPLPRYDATMRSCRRIRQAGSTPPRPATAFVLDGIMLPRC